MKMVEKIRRRFEATFRYDDRGMPRVWSAGDDIDTIFAGSRTEADLLLILLAKFSGPIPETILSSADFDATSVILITPSRQALLKDRFKREADAAFIDAKRATVAMTTSIPIWFIALAVILGWNEFLTIVSNPLLTFSLILGAGVAYGVWYGGLSGPVFEVIKASVTEFWKQAMTKVQAMEAYERAGVVVDRLIRSERRERDVGREVPIELENMAS